MIIHYVTGSRADFGLMLPCLRKLDADVGIDLGIVVTGQHLTKGYGRTVEDIEQSGLAIVARMPVALSGSDGAQMALAMADELRAMTGFWNEQRPDAVLLLGDRGEMLAGALAAIHLGLPVIHVGGGERSGTLDESFRHAITKLSHYHLCATHESARRIEAMGEHRATIHVVGAPGLVGIHDASTRSGIIAQSFGSPDLTRPVALVLFHPVVQEAQSAANQMRSVIQAVRETGYLLFVLRPNSDAGGGAINRFLDTIADSPDARVFDHLSRQDYLAAIREADLLVGNSSSGIIESASLGTACLNIGRRQNLRQRNANTVDCDSFEIADLKEGLAQAAQLHGPFDNVYGDGKTDDRMVAIIKQLDLVPESLQKANRY